MALSDEVVPALLASKLLAASGHVKNLTDDIGELMAEVGLRQFALRAMDYHLLTTVDSKPWFEEIERIQCAISLLFASVSGMVILYEARFGTMEGTEQEVMMKNHLARAKLGVCKMSRLFIQVATCCLTFDYIAKHGSVGDIHFLEFLLLEANMMSRLVQISTGILKFHLEAVRTICTTGVLL